MHIAQAAVQTWPDLAAAVPAAAAVRLVWRKTQVDKLRGDGNEGGGGGGGMIKGRDK